MKTIWKVLSNYKEILELIAQIAEVAKDKKVTDEEVRAVVDSVLPLAITLGLVEDDVE
jgi:hypothetical protein